MLIEECAKKLGYKSSQRKEYIVLSKGTPLSLNPNTLYHKIILSTKDGSIDVMIKVPPPTGIIKKARRIALAECEELLSFIKNSSKGEGSSRRLRFSMFDRKRLLSSLMENLGWFLLSLFGGILMVLAVLSIVGIDLVEQEILHIQKRAKILENLGEFYLPSQKELSEIDFPFKMGVNLVLIFPIVFLFSFGFLGFLFISELWSFPSRYTPWVFLLFLLALFFGFLPLLGLEAFFYSSLAMVLLYGCYLFTWGLRREYTLPEGPPKGISARKIVFISLVGVFLCALIFDLSRQKGNLLKKAALLRDRYLLRSGLGERLVEFYYRHTPYAAEIISSPTKRYQKVAMVLAPCPGWLERFLQKEGFYLDRPDPEPAREKIKEGGYELYILMENSKLRGITPPERTILLEKDLSPSKFEQIFKEFCIKSHGGRNLAGLSFLGLFSILLGGPLIAGIFIAVFIYLLFYMAGRVLFRKFLLPFFLLFVVGTLILFGASLFPHKRDLILDIRDTYGSCNLSTYKWLLERLDSKDRDIRYEAIYAIYVYLSHNRRWKEGAGRIIPLLRDEDPRVRAWAAGVLGLLGDRSALSALADSLKDENIYVRIRSAEALGDLRDPRSESLLIQSLRDDWWFVGARALEALRKLRGR
jgi:hypothetical protein